MNIRFTKEDRSTFAYWFAHWCAYNMTALNLGAWKFRYLFHDIEKPFLRLFLPYEKVQYLHRRIHPHHGEFFLKYGWLFWDDLVIDWECSRFTKQQSPYDAREVLPKELYKLKLLGATADQLNTYASEVLVAMDRLGL